MSASSAAEDVQEALDYAGQDLRGKDFSGRSLVGANFAGSDLTDAIFYEADVSEAEFTGANLDGTNFEQARAIRACFGNASMRDSRLFGVDLSSATLSGADLSGSDLRNATMTHARMVRCTLDDADLECATLRDVSARGSSCVGTNFNRAKLGGSGLRELEGAQKASWLEAEITSVDFTGAYLLRRHILDQNYIHEFRNRGIVHRVVYWLWWITSDCGRSMLRWGICTLMVAVFFGLGYMTVDVDFGSNQTLLSPFYFSLVTITTLGYGDVLPRSMGAQIMVMAEVALGYMMLGGMLSIFSDKMARRAG